MSKERLCSYCGIRQARNGIATCSNKCARAAKETCPDCGQPSINGSIFCGECKSRIIQQNKAVHEEVMRGLSDFIKKYKKSDYREKVIIPERSYRAP